MKRILVAILLIAGILFVVKYFILDNGIRSVFPGPCQRTITYSIGQISPIYDLDESTLKTMLNEIDNAWSAAAGKNLFEYDSNSSLSINLIYEEEQRFLNKEQSIASRIEYEKMSYKNTEHELLKLKERYKQEKKKYDEAITEYNKMMEKPSTQVQNDITRQAHEIEERRRKLNDLASQINEKVENVNRISERIDEMLADYNAHFDTTKAFNQGDYQSSITGKVINIYGYRNLDELKLVLAHEMGHALGLQHVQNPESIMYYLMKDQSTGQLRFTNQDTAALNNLCGT